MDEAIEYGLQQLCYTSIRTNQKKVVEGYLSGKDVFFCSPTGSGKSLTFEIAPFVQSYKQDSNSLPKKCCIVVSPLVSLMKSQEKNLLSRGVKALYLSDLDAKDTKHQALYDVLQGDYNILLSSPESILGHHRNIVSELSKKNLLGSIFIDEAHCIRKFGQMSTTTKQPAFRPLYGKLGELRSLAGPEVPVIALTATASLETQQLIKQCLCMTDSIDVISSPNKLNIRYAVHQVKSDNVRENFSWLIKLLREHGKVAPRIIVFFRKVDHMATVFKHVRTALENDTDDICGKERICLMDMFHMKTPDSVKDSICRSFQDENTYLRVVLCTTSFSMGLDVKGVDTVVHYGPSNDLEDYLQETGRAGRDPDQNCHAIIVKYKRCTGSKNVTKQMKELLLSSTCRRKKLIRPFATEEFIASPDPIHNCCDVCSKECKCQCACQNICTCESFCTYQESTVLKLMLAASEEESSSSDSDSSTAFLTDSDFEGYTSRKARVLNSSDDMSE